MPDPQLNIGVNVNSTGDGAKKAIEDLHRIGQAANSAKESAKAFSAALDAREGRQAVQTAKDTAGALSDMTKEAKSFGPEAEKVESNLKRLGQGFKQLGHEVPLVGVAINALKNPFTILGTAIAALVVWFQRQMSVQRELIEQNAELAVRFDPVILKMVTAAQVAEELNERMRKHNETLREQNSVLEQNKLAQQAATDAMQRRADAQAAILDAQKRLALAQAGADPEARAAVEKDFAARAEQQRQLAAAGRIESRSRALRDTVAARAEARAAIPGALAAVGEAKQQASQETAEVDAMLKVTDAEGKSLEDQLKELEKHGATMPVPGLPGITRATGPERERINAAILQNKNERDQLLARRQRAQGPVAAAEARLNQLTGQEAAANAALPQLEAGFNKTVGDETARRATARTVMDLDEKTAKAEMDAAEQRKSEAAVKAIERFGDTLVRKLDQLNSRIQNQQGQ